jgi:hypothetical protein
MQTQETITAPQPCREFLESTIAKARAAIAFASPAADMSYARAVLFFAEMKLEALNKTGR